MGDRLPNLDAVLKRKQGKERNVRRTPECLGAMPTRLVQDQNHMHIFIKLQTQRVQEFVEDLGIQVKLGQL